MRLRAQRLNPSCLSPRLLKDGTCAHDQQTAQIAVSRIGDPAQSCFAAAAVLSRHESNPSCHLSAVAEVMSVADAGCECAGGDGANAETLHQLFAPCTRILDMQVKERTVRFVCTTEIDRSE